MRLSAFRILVLSGALLVAACATNPPPAAPASPDRGATGPATVGDSAPVGSNAAHLAEVETWRSGRIERLRKPDGWLSLIGLHWLTEGEQTVGRGAGNDIALGAGPDAFGVIRRRGGEVRFRVSPAAGQVFVKKAASLVQDPETDTIWHVLTPDTRGEPSVVRAGDLSFIVIERGGQLGLRVRNAKAPELQAFAGIEHFPVDDSWRIEAEWVPHATPREFEIQTVIGTIDRMPSPGVARFRRNGRDYEIHPVIEEGSAELFIIFADRTSGKETYGPGRFLYAPVPTDGRLILDFNKAYNPPCAFNDYSTCPLPPPENRLDLRVTAGEKKYARAGH